MASAILRASFDEWSPQALLAYFQQRTNVRYLAVEDAELASARHVMEVLENRFTFHGESHLLPAGFDWLQNPSQEFEWQILLHKFYFGVGLGREYCQSHDRRYLEKWVELVTAWIDTGSLAMLSSDVMGRRVQNWVFAYYYFIGEAHAPISGAFHQKFLQSLHDQVTYLCTHLTPARNHRTIELYAIFLVAVVFPEFANATEWLNFSRQLLHENIQADFLADGVHCELSTDYHHLVLRNYLGILKLAELNRIEMPASMLETVQKALDFAKYVHRPDGAIPSLSDGDGRDFRWLLRQGYEQTGDKELLFVATLGQEGRAPRQRTRVFATSGYAIQRSGWGSDDDPYQDQRYLIFDCGPLGAGNHGHLDLLSFEMAAYGHPLIVDPGRYTYHEPKADSGETNWRACFRSTSYHNTVVVDGKDQTRYEYQKNRFRIMGPPPEHKLIAETRQDGSSFLHGTATSYEYPVIHERKILFVRRSYWVITDTLRPHEDDENSLHTYDLYFHLAADAFGRVSIGSVGGFAQLCAPHLFLLHTAANQIAAPCTLQNGFISPTYGIKHPAPIASFSYHGGALTTYTILFPFQDQAPDLCATLIGAGQDNEPELQITVGHGASAVTDSCFSRAHPLCQ